MASSIIYPYGSAQGVVVSAGKSITVFAPDNALVYQVGYFPNQPPVRGLLGSVVNGTSNFGPFTNATTIDIVAGAGMTLYAVGTDPAILEKRSSQTQLASVSLNATGAITSVSMQNGLVTSTTAAAVAGTVPTGAVLDAAAQMSVGDSFNWSVINTGPNTFTVTAAANHTIVGAAAVATATSGLFRTVKTATGTFITYRLS